jgi:hypothetical protein
LVKKMQVNPWHYIFVINVYLYVNISIRSIYSLKSIYILVK